MSGASAEPGRSGAKASAVAAVARAKEKFCGLLETPPFLDLAFIGNASAVYPWEPSRVIDLDVCLFVSVKDERAGSELARLRDQLVTIASDYGGGGELRIINGAYKPPAVPPDFSFVLLAHLALFTEENYLDVPPAQRWCWRKYPCIREPERLARLAAPRPTLAEVLYGRKGVEERLRALEAGRVRLQEWHLPDLMMTAFEVCADDPVFVESCFAAAATCARNHCRALGLDQADTLPNRAFFAWYTRTVLPSPDLSRLAALKEICRNQGLALALKEAPALAIAYLRRLRHTLRASVG